MPITLHVSGHIDLTEQEFKAYYVPWLDAIRFADRPAHRARLALPERGCRFVVGDAKGADALFQVYARDHNLPTTVYHMFEAPRRTIKRAGLVGGFKGDEERDAAMTAASHADLAWVRTGRERSGTAKNLERHAATAQQRLERLLDHPAPDEQTWAELVAILWCMQDDALAAALEQAQAAMLRPSWADVSRPMRISRLPDHALALATEVVCAAPEAMLARMERLDARWLRAVWLPTPDAQDWEPYTLDALRALSPAHAGEAP